MSELECTLPEISGSRTPNSNLSIYATNIAGDAIYALHELPDVYLVH